jgi:methyl-accepting chemotaxis protein
MDFSNIWVLVGFSAGILLLFVLIALFFISRKSQRVMQSMLDIMTDPGRAKIRDASRILQEIMADEIDKITTNFKNIQETLRAQLNAAVALEKQLGTRNEALVTTANDAVQKISKMSGRIENTVTGLQKTVDSDQWTDIAKITDTFADTLGKTLDNITTTTDQASKQIDLIDSKIATWNEESKKLDAELQNATTTNTERFEKMAGVSDSLQDRIIQTLAKAKESFEEMKNTADGYEAVIKNTNKMLSTYLAKLDSFDKQAKKQLTNQMNMLTNTANVVGAQVMLTESSVENQIKKLTEAVETVIASATETESSVRGISTELAGLTNHFETEIKDFATDVVSELKTVSGVANTTLNDTKTAANAFSESVKSMATGVRETLIEMNTAHTQLAGQSEGLIKMSTETTNQLKPLAELIEKYYAALPELANSSNAAGANLTKIIADMDEKIASIRATVEQSTQSVTESAAKLEDLTGFSRQQMIDLMSDYAKAVETMQTLNKQMMVARATAPMDAISAPAAPAPKPRVSSRDFVATSGREFDKMYEQTIDLTRAMGTDIPDVVWKKYHDGDKTIFAKWLAKTVRATAKKQIQELIKSDSVFRSQATQFVRTFEKLIAAARQTDTPDKLVSALAKTDLGIIYTALGAKI